LGKVLIDPGHCPACSKRPIILDLCFQVRQELANIQAKRALMEAVMEESKQLKEIGGYPEFVSSAVSMQFLLSILHAFAKAFFNLEHSGS